MKATWIKTNSTVALALLAVVVTMGINACKEHQSGFSAVDRKSFGVTVAFTENKIILTPKNPTYTITSFSGMKQSANVSGSLAVIREGRFMPLAVGEKLSFSYAFKANDKYDCTTTSLAGFKGEVTAECTGDDPGGSDPDSGRDFSEFRRACEELKSKDEAYWVGDTICQCKNGMIRYELFGKVDEFVEACRNGTNPVPQDTVITRIHDAAVEMENNYSYNINDDYCECYGVGPLNYKDFAGNADPVESFRKACMNNSSTQDDGNPDTSGDIKVRLKNACQALAPDPAYNVTDDYCECFGVFVSYDDYVSAANPEEALTAACRGQ